MGFGYAPTHRVAAAPGTTPWQLSDEEDIAPGYLQGRSPEPVAPAPTSGLSRSMPAFDMGGGMGGGMQMPPMPTEPTQSSTQAMEGLQAATPDQTPVAGFELSAPNSLRQGLGNRRPPDGISGLKVLTY
jgi:hypothetical protein